MDVLPLRAFLRRAGEAGVEERLVLGISSLYAPDQWRSRGSSKILQLNVLHEMVASVDAPLRDCPPVMVFGLSAIGHDFYHPIARYVPSYFVAWSTDEMQHTILEAHADDLEAVYIERSDLDELLTSSIETLRAEVAGGPLDRHCLAIVPSRELLEYQFEGSDLPCRIHLGHALELIGASIVGAEPPAFCTWIYPVGSDMETLWITHVRVGRRAELDALLCAAIRLAQQHGLREVRATEPPRHLLTLNEDLVEDVGSQPVAMWLEDDTAPFEWIRREAFMET